MKKKNIYFILSDENLFHPYYFLGVLKNLPREKYKVIGITVLKETYSKGFLYFLYQQYSLWGFVGFMTIASMSVVTTILNKLRVPGYYSIESIAHTYNISFTERYNVNDATHLAHIKSLHPDIIVSSCGQIFKDELLHLPTIACINRHTALLPKYGGVLPVFWAMYHEEREFGVSIHYMTPKVDQGNIIAQKKIEIERKSSLFKNYIIGFQESVGTTLKALSNMEQKKIIGTFRKNSRAYFSFPDQKTLSSFRKRFVTFSPADIFFHRKLLSIKVN